MSQAISALPELRVLASLKPPSFGMRSRIGATIGDDLAALCSLNKLQELDLCVAVPSHLTAIGRASQLQKLTLR
jgi:hypothetical protein